MADESIPFCPRNVQHCRQAMRVVPSSEHDTHPGVTREHAKHKCVGHVIMAPGRMARRMRASMLTAAKGAIMPCTADAGSQVQTAVVLPARASPMIACSGPADSAAPHPAWQQMPIAAVYIAPRFAMKAAHAFCEACSCLAPVATKRSVHVCEAVLTRQPLSTQPRPLRQLTCLTDTVLKLSSNARRCPIAPPPCRT